MFSQRGREKFLEKEGVRQILSERERQELNRVSYLNRERERVCV